MNKIKLIHLSLAVIVMFALSVDSLLAQTGDDKVFLIDDFESEEVGALPEKWLNQKGEVKTTEFSDELRKTYNYKIEQEGSNQFLAFKGVRGKHMSFPLINKDGVDINKTPILSWKWRIHDIPDGANEDEDGKNDVAASIYVAFDMGRVALFKKVPKSIRYTWSSTLPEGKEMSKLFGNQKIVVVGSGNNQNGEWVTFERNIVEDYKRLFGDDPPSKPIAILILSDGDSTGKISEADYDDIVLKSKPAN